MVRPHSVQSKTIMHASSAASQEDRIELEKRSRRLFAPAGFLHFLSATSRSVVLPPPLAQLAGHGNHPMSLHDADDDETHDADAPSHGGRVAPRAPDQADNAQQDEEVAECEASIHRPDLFETGADSEYQPAHHDHTDDENHLFWIFASALTGANDDREQEQTAEEDP